MWTVLLRVEGFGVVVLMCCCFGVFCCTDVLLFFGVFCCVGVSFVVVAVVVLSCCLDDAEQTWLKQGCPVDEDDEFELNIETHVIKQYMRRQEEKNEI